MICPNCGAENRDEAKFCAQCGKQLTEESGNVQEIEVTSEEVKPRELEKETLASEDVEPPEPLPEGALLYQRRYEIVLFIETKGGTNEYEAIETEPRKRCSVCQVLNATDNNFCEQCGNSLDNATLETLKIRLLEARSPNGLQPFWTFAEKGLQHQSIIAPIASFTEEPYDERTYIALPAIEGTPLPSIEAEDAATAIAWAYLLADAFAYLSERGFGLKEPLNSAVIFTDRGEPFILTEAICLEPCDWKQVQDELAKAVEHWMESAQADEWIEQTTNAIKRAENWREVTNLLQRLSELIQALPAMRVEFCAMTDVGRRREHNEDSYLTIHFERCHLDKTESLAILAVADGMGGHTAGEVASKLCLQVFGSHLLNAIQDWVNFGEPEWHEALKSAAVEANRQVFAEAQVMRNNMGTTLTVAVLCGNKAFFANVGDSRSYLLQGGKLKQITKDHSLVQQYVDAGLITPEQARWHPQRNIITQAIGIEPKVQVDTFEATLQRGDLVLVCSDGLVDMVEDSEIERVLLSEPNLAAAVQKLIKIANEAGGDDNITVAIAKVM